MTEIRIRQLAAILLALVVVLAIALHDLMVVEHLQWRIRAQQNHVDFRGTPSLRGPIKDRDGRDLARDVPGFDLEFTYREFRRRHPVGATVHGANLLRAALGREPYRWTDPETPGLAFRALTKIEGIHLSAFDDRASRPELLERLPRYGNRSSLSRDLGFYLSSVVSQLTDLTFQRAHARLVELAGQPGPVLEAFENELRAELEAEYGKGIGVRVGLRQRYFERLGELRELAGRIETERRVRRERFEAAYPARSQAQREERLRNPHFDLFRRLEDLRVSAENLADTHGAPPGGRDALQDPDFWCWLALSRDRRLDSVRSWFARNGSTRQALQQRQREEIDTFVDEARPGRREAISGEIQRLTKAVDAASGEIQALRDRLKKLGRGSEAIEARRRRRDALVSARQKLKLLEERLRALLSDQRRDLLWRVEGSDFGRASGQPYDPPLLLDETRPRALLREIGHRFALSIETRAERHPGFGVRRTAHREVAEDLGGLGPYVGSVSREQLDDLVRAELTGQSSASDPEGQVDAIAESFESTGAFWSGVGFEADAAMVRGLRESLRGILRTNARIGRSGIELAMDARLRGRLGLRAVDEMRSGEETSLRGVTDVVPGGAVTLTIDPALQQLADRITSDLGEASERALVALDARTGDVLALSGFGPISRPTKAQPDLELRFGHNAAATFPTFDPSIGSVIKPLIALEYLDGLRRGAYEVPFEEFETCRFSRVSSERYRSRELQSQVKFGCEEDHRDASQNVVTALRDSCNISFYETFWHSKDTVAGPVGPAMARRIGWLFGDERNRIVGLDPRMHLTPREGSRQVGANGRIFGRSPMVRTVGYDFKVSALDLARAYAMVATGRNPAVGLVQERETGERPRLGWHRDDLALVREGLRQSLFAGSGRARGEDLRSEFDQGVLDAVHGKTGTAFIGYGGEPRKPLHNSWFATFLGTEEQAGIVVVAVAYKVKGTGAEFAGRMVTSFYRGIRDTAQTRRRYFGRFE